MSIKYIKSTLEQYLNTNITTNTIKWANSAVYTLNSVSLTEDEINALDEFIAPIVIPITEDRELISSSQPFRYELFFQISIYTKVNLGTGSLYDLVHTLTTLFKEKNINGVVCNKTETLSSFQDGEYLITPCRIRVHYWSS